MTSTANVVSHNEPTAAQSILDTFEQLKKIPKPKWMRYRVSEWCPMDPVYWPTKSYDMYIFHPVALSKFLAELEADKLGAWAVFNFRPASREEWAEWGDEMLQEMRERRGGAENEF